MACSVGRFDSFTHDSKNILTHASSEQITQAQNKFNYHPTDIKLSCRSVPVTYLYNVTHVCSSRNQPKNACPYMRAFTMSSKRKTLMSVLRTIQFLRLYVKTLIKVFLLELIVKARMFGHAFLGRFWDECMDRPHAKYKKMRSIA